MVASLAAARARGRRIGGHGPALVAFFAMASASAEAPEGAVPEERLDDFRQAGDAYTADGGATWTFPGVLEMGVFRSDPVLEPMPLATSTSTAWKAARSTDGGLAWSAPVALNDDPPDADAWQWFGTPSVAPNGRIDVPGKSNA